MFGESNFVGCFVWKRRTSSAMDQSNTSTDHEYVFSYHRANFKPFRGFDKDFKGYSNPDNDPRGIWTTGDLTVGMNGDMRPNQFYDLIDPKTGKLYKPNFNRVWSYTPKSMNKLISEGRVIFPKDTSKRPMRKRFANELKNKTNPFSTWMTRVGMNTEGTRIANLLFASKTMFNYAKPLSLIKNFIHQTTSGSDIILDFFSGSGTTAHAVMQLNAEDGGNRKFIMVQLPEETDKRSEAYKAGYKNICEIGKERIRRAGEKIKNDNKNNEHIKNLDIGFRVLKCDSSNMKDVYYNPANYESKLFESLADNIKEGRTPEDLLFQVMLDLGILLSSKIKESTISDKKIFNVANGFLIACFDKDVHENTIRAIAHKKPYYFIMRDSSLADDNVATNFDQIFSTFSSDTVRKIL